MLPKEFLSFGTFTIHHKDCKYAVKELDYQEKKGTTKKKSRERVGE